MRENLDKMIENQGVFAYLTQERMHISIKSSNFANKSAKEPLSSNDNHAVYGMVRQQGLQQKLINMK